MTSAASGFGLIVVGDELLSGHRRDAHLYRFRELLRERGHGLVWCWILPDEPAVLGEHLARSFAAERPVFCCGGIGATPDDRTRECAARAAGVPLRRHPGAVAEIEAVFGEAAYPDRILMADLPAGCELIPNPYNRIPGFSLGEHHFLPGFPELAWPMAEWVLERRYPAREAPVRELSLRVLDVPESALVPLMRRLGARHPGLKLFSLPRMGATRSVELGFRGRVGLAQAFEDLRRELESAGFRWESSPARD
jgi:molybdopterin-biosynthesis enzyme MoeA-like protein